LAAKIVPGWNSLARPRSTCRNSVPTTFRAGRAGERIFEIAQRRAVEDGAERSHARALSLE
jgi:hypothetical protein